jgi:hypothetical protein
MRGSNFNANHPLKRVSGPCKSTTVGPKTLQATLDALRRMFSD